MPRQLFRRVIVTTSAWLVVAPLALAEPQKGGNQFAWALGVLLPALGLLAALQVPPRERKVKEAKDD